MNDTKTVVALGFFDGVHLGHGALLRRTVERARERGVLSAAHTFDRAPRALITGQAVPLLTTPEERRELMTALYGIERVIVAPFDREMMTRPWPAFLDGLTGRYGAAGFVAGHDYRFGYRGEGGVDELSGWCAARGLGCDIIPRVELDGVTVSSSYIRSLIEAGDVARAGRFLGHPYAVSGSVRHGQGLGTRQLVPTANLIPGGGRLLPKFGVYVTRVSVDGGAAMAGVTNVGVRPTVSGGDTAVSVETYLPDFSGDLYGRSLRVDFLGRLRDEQKFGSTRELHDQIARDIARSRAWKEGNR